MRLTAVGRRLVDKDLGGALFEACGLGDELSVIQQDIVRLRSNLLRNTGSKEGET
ncbi:MAG TPA: hypothetical protein VGN43_10320 [Steroidobacteraceae bacterium]|nr:hypothetical protein [Steroidobacteraceae bacterium]